MRISTLFSLALGLSALSWAGCKTEVNNPPPQNTVVREVPAHDQVDVVHDHDSTDQPKVENNIKVDH